MDRIELAKKIYSESNTKMSQVAHSFWNEYLELLHFAGNKLNTLQEGCEIIKLTMKMMLKCEENEPKNILLTIRCALRAVEEAIAEVECSDSET